MSKIQVTRSSMSEFDEYIDEIKCLWDSRWLTNNGQKHKLLESQLRDYLRTANVSLFSNGHLALEIIMEAFQLEGEVITTPFTFASTTHAIVRKGLQPVFCDINQDDYTIDCSKIERLITDKTTAIIPVHVYGNVCDVEAIEKIAQKYNLKIIYDAAHTFGVTVNDSGIGSFGDASMFSFHATKVFNTIEGGAITCNNTRIKDKLEALKNFGITSPETVDYIGGNAKMNEFQAAMGICNLRHVDEEIKKREKVVERYNASLSNIPGIKISSVKPGVRSNYAYFPVLFDGYSKNRDHIFEELKENDIMARKYFYPLTNSLDCYKGRFNANDTPIAKYVSERILTLPLYADLALEDVDRICKIIKR